VGSITLDTGLRSAIAAAEREASSGATVQIWETAWT